MPPYALGAQQASEGDLTLGVSGLWVILSDQVSIGIMWGQVPWWR